MATTTIVLIEGVAELKWDGSCYQPFILRKGGHEARNVRTGETIIVEDKLIAHEHYSSDIKSSIRYVARALAENEHKDTSVSLKQWLETITNFTKQMTACLKSVQE